MSKERGASLVFLFAGAYGILMSLQMPFGSWREPGAGMMPLGISLLLLLSGTLWMIFGKEKRKEKQKTDWSGLLAKYATPIRILLVTVGFVLLLETAGYALSAFLYVFLLFFWISRFRLPVALGMAIALGAGSWYFFGVLLSVPLPRGIL